MSKTHDTILKLNKLTKDNEIHWEQNWKTPESLGSTEKLSGYSYTAKVEDKFIRIYKLEQRHYTDEDEFIYYPFYRLEFTDLNGKGLWKFPEDFAIDELYESVLYKTSGVDDFLTSFTKE